MKHTRLIILMAIFGLAFFSSCRKDSALPKTRDITRAFFGDKKNNAVVTVDVEDFKLVGKVPTGHEITYTADRVGSTGKVYAVNRGSDAIDVVDCASVDLVKTIVLPHHPRSAESVNKDLGLVAVTGMDKPMVSIIDMKTDEVVATVGSPQVTFPVSHNHSGSHACGHPFWLDRHHFILPDRGNLKLSTYFIAKSNGEWQTALVNTIDIPSPIHQIIPSKGNYLGEPGYFYATAEGITTEGANNVYPSILELKFTPHEGLQINRSVTLDSGGSPLEDMGLHHGDFHPFEKLVYVGSREGNIFVVNYETMSVQSVIPAGKGIGHVKMIKSKKLAVAINHNDVFVTIIDLATNTKIKDVFVSDRTDLVGQTTIQAHPKYFVSKDGNKFYSFVTAEGQFYELDLNTLEVSRKLDVGGQPAQGSFVPMTIEE
ncbi:MAG TPA: hypothetical protein ENK85_02510 [Saprospiraceae bacterium]|nr:hypothetical protein [Saprospiraceae bacterium]